MNKMAKSVLIMVLIILAFPEKNIRAQESSQKYSLQQCLDFAVNNSYAAHKAQLDVREIGRASCRERV